MGFFGFGGPSEEDLKQINKGLKAENASLTKENKQVLKDLAKFREDQNEYQTAQNKRSNKYYADQDESNRVWRKKLTLEQEYAIEKAERDADKRVRQIEKDADTRVRAAEAKIQGTDNAVRAAVLKEKEASLEATTELEVEVATQTSRADSAEAQMETLEETIETMTSLMQSFAKENQAFATKIIEKLPQVTLDKFHINVEVPSTETHIHTGGQKGGEQKKN